jgi:riboflavin kinase / FMN adenylyltransferase
MSMKVVDSLSLLQSLPPGGAMSIGNFDGLHLGHRAILDAIKRSGLKTTVVTFEPHPLTVLRPDMAPPRLMSEAAKLEGLEQLGIDHVVLLRPTSEVLNLSARQFYEAVRDGARPRLIAEGKDFYFGKARQGTMQVLGEWCQQDRIELKQVDDVVVELPTKEVVEASSSLVRWLLLHGRTREANACIGGPFVLCGKVVAGNARGRAIGFPTANLDCGDQLVPHDGVYRASTTVDGNRFSIALSIGTTPTFDGQQRLIEAHLVGFTGDLYGKTLAIELGDWLRGQKKFRSKDELVEQLARDVLLCR